MGNLFGGSKGYTAKYRGILPGQIKVGPKAWKLLEPVNLWGAQDYELAKKALRADREAEIATWHAKMHEANARMFAEYAQKAQHQAEVSARQEVLEKAPKLKEYVEYCDEFKQWLTEHKDRFREPEMLKNYNLCGNVDAYLELATRDSIKGVAHGLGFRLVGEPPGAEQDVEVKAVQDGYAPDYYKMHPAQQYVPAGLEGGLNPPVLDGPRRIGRLEAGMETAALNKQQVDAQAVMSHLKGMRAPHQELEDAAKNAPQGKFGKGARGFNNELNINPDDLPDDTGPLMVAPAMAPFPLLPIVRQKSKRETPAKLAEFL